MLISKIIKIAFIACLIPYTSVTTAKIISIDKAEYFAAFDWTCKGDVTAKISAECLNKEACAIPVNDVFLNNPCPDKKNILNLKKLWVNATCERATDKKKGVASVEWKDPVRGWEGQAATLVCTYDDSGTGSASSTPSK